MSTQSLQPQRYTKYKVLSNLLKKSSGWHNKIYLKLYIIVVLQLYFELNSYFRTLQTLEYLDIWWLFYFTPAFYIATQVHNFVYHPITWTFIWSRLFQTPAQISLSGLILNLFNAFKALSFTWLFSLQEVFQSFPSLFTFKCTISWPISWPRLISLCPSPCLIRNIITFPNYSKHNWILNNIALVHLNLTLEQIIIQPKWLIFHHQNSKCTNLRLKSGKPIYQRRDPTNKLIE